MKIPFDPSRRNALVVRMLVYGRAGRRPLELRAAVDTGASAVMIPPAAAHRLRYSVDDLEPQRITTGDGVFYAPRIVLDRVDIGPTSARGVEAICHNLPRESMLDALVGLSFLTKFDVRFDFGAWEMELAPCAG